MAHGGLKDSRTAAPSTLDVVRSGVLGSGVDEGTLAGSAVGRQTYIPRSLVVGLPFSFESCLE